MTDDDFEKRAKEFEELEKKAAKYRVELRSSTAGPFDSDPNDPQRFATRRHGGKRAALKVIDEARRAHWRGRIPIITLIIVAASVLISALGLILKLFGK